MSRKDILEIFIRKMQEGKELYFDADVFCDLLDYISSSGDFTYFDQVLEAALKQHPNDENLLVIKCRQLIDMSKPDQALKIIHNLKQVDKQDRDEILMQCYCSKNKYAEVLEIIEENIREKVSYLQELFEAVAPLMNDLDMCAQADDFITKGLKFFPDSSILNEEYCFVLEEESKYKEAIRICNKLIDTNPYSYYYWFTMGRLYSMDSQYDKAIEAFDFALTCDDSDIDLKQLRAYCLYANENYDKAIEAYKEIIESGKCDGLNLSNSKQMLCESYIKVHNYEGAYPLYKETLKSQSKAVSIVYQYAHLILCCLETDRFKEAQKTLDKALKAYPDDMQLQMIRSLMMMMNQSEPIDRIANIVIESMFGCGPDTDQSDFKDLLTEDDLKGIDYMKKGEAQKALNLFKKIQKKDPRRPFLHVQLASAYALLNMQEEAKKEWLLATFDEMEDYLRQVDKINRENEDVPDLMSLSESDFIKPADIVNPFLNKKENIN